MTLTPRQQGEQFEGLLAVQHQQYYNQDRVLLWHSGLRCKVVGKGQMVREDSRPDFEGALYGSGRHIAFDAKSTTKATYSHPKSRMHQCNALWDVHQAGGLAFLLVSVNLEMGYILWPDTRWQGEKGFTVHLDTLASWEGLSFVMDRDGLCDWLRAIENEETP